VIFIINMSYITAIVWLILCEATLDFNDISPGEHTAPTDDDPDIFMIYFAVEHRTQMEVLIMACYFSFTSLTTVGFGDYHPRGNLERFVCAFILLIGVAIFSYIMGNFITILQEMKEFAADLDDGDNLSKFFGTMKHFNDNVPIDQRMI
jgi:hypothetical protein